MYRLPLFDPGEYELYRGTANKLLCIITNQHIFLITDGQRDTLSLQEITAISVDGTNFSLFRGFKRPHISIYSNTELLAEIFCEKMETANEIAQQMSRAVAKHGGNKDIQVSKGR